VYAEIATVLRLDFHSGSVSRLAESLKAVLWKFTFQQKTVRRL
jgi:hypothetical protein